MIAENAVRDRLLRFLQNQLSLEAFEAWLVSESWDMHRDSSPSAQNLVVAIELLLAERSSSELSDARFRNELASLANNIISSVEIAPSAAQTVNSSA